MMKIGIIGDKLPERIFPGDRVWEENYKITGFYRGGNYDNVGMEITGNSRYGSLTELFEHTDAIMIDFHYPEALSYAEKALKNFRHVYLTSAKNIHRSDYIFLQKIAEESNVVLFPDFGVNYRSIFRNAGVYAGDLVFARIHHSLPVSFPLGEQENMFSTVLDDLSFFSLRHENLKKISACALRYPGTSSGMISSRIDFDTGLSVQMVIENGINNGLTADFFFKNCKISFVSAEGENKLSLLNYTTQEQIISEISPEDYSGRQPGLSDFGEIITSASSHAISTHFLFKNYFVAKSLMDKVSFFIPAGIEPAIY